MTNPDYPIAVPREPGLYESAVLRDRVTIRVNGLDNADTVVERGDTRYEHAILDFRHYADEFGPFRRLDGEPEPTESEPNAANDDPIYDELVEEEQARRDAELEDEAAA
ncbi:hypothetical protein SEA_BARNSTORMER_31 [Microbacterium phage Barnstormer]|uniref:Uncharacterized protein n=1 Tax=Microbacterium phage Barnstormer TaxID=3028491 RepID=A0AAF0CJT3_9CAUD|nr:hypothetical protein SEA_BARNSTORMER_31 [Microbacterium phage Barnstormer]